MQLMENHKQTIVATGAAATSETDIVSPDRETADELDEISEKIEALADVDPAEAADWAVDVADRLARRLEEDDR